MIGSYHLVIKFGDTVIPVSIATLKELTIIQDMNKFLPDVRLRLSDNSGMLTHVFPFDKNMNSIYIELAPDSTDTDNKNGFNFSVYRRTPDGSQSTPSSTYDIIGLLDVKGLFSPDRSRGFKGMVNDTIKSVAAEMGFSKFDISPSLAFEKKFVQPVWTNAQFLNNIREFICGSNGEYGFKCFVKTIKGKNTFVFRPISEMMQDQVSYKFVLNDTQYEDRFPIFNYAIYDNYRVYGTFASKQQGYSYFDYENSVFVDSTEDVQSYQSLSDYFLIDTDDTTDNNSINDTGRTNEFSEKFSGYVKGSYGNRLSSLVKMWITTQGLPNAVPGQTVNIFFPHGVQADNLYSYQYSGYWLVERVVHNCGDVFLTKLLLTRHGLDTDKSTTLLRASTRKKS